MKFAYVLPIALSSVAAEQPGTWYDGVSEARYDCTYTSSMSPRLDFSMTSTDWFFPWSGQVECGKVDGSYVSIPAPDAETIPTLTLVGANDNDYYTIVLANPHDNAEFLGVIAHQFTANVKGSDFKNGVVSSTATQVIPYFGPGQPIPFVWSHYCYLIFKQDNGITDFSTYSNPNGKSKFDVPKLQSDFSLT